MAKPEHMDAIEKTIDTVEETVSTVSRIPKVALNGTTKKQQIVIIGTCVGVGVALGVAGHHTIMKGLNKLRRKKASSVTIH
jgi:hypothetical protein